MKKIFMSFGVFILFSLCFHLEAKKTNYKLTSGAILSASSFEKIILKTEKSAITSVNFSEDNRLLISANLSGVVNIFEHKESQLENKYIPKFLKNDKMISVSFTDKFNRSVRIGTIQNKIYDVDIVSNSVLSEKKGVPYGNCFSQITLDGNFLFTSAKSKFGGFQMINMIQGQSIRTYSGHKKIVKALSLSKDNKILVSIDEDDVIKIWDPTNIKPKATLKNKGKYISCAKFSVDSKYLYISTLQGYIHILDLETNEIDYTLAKKKKVPTATLR